jgi:excinuclease UvrABC nuclease subunit
MFLKKRIIIDIRSSDEILEKRAISYSDDTILMYIPVQYIKFNQEIIRDLSKVNTIYILCKKARRSSYIKKTFFPNNPNIISIDGGINQLEKMHSLMRNLRIVVYKIRKLKKTSYGKFNQYYIMYIFIIFVLFVMYKIR